VRKTRDETSELIHNLEMEASELEHQELTLKQKIKENYQINLEKVPLPQEIDMEASQEQINTIKQKLTNLGNVNLMALEEYERGTERLNFLNQQRDDLLSAKDTLKETIKKINFTARKRFKDVFIEVRENFRQTFTHFFDGGEADLRIPEGEDPLEAQIEITARPAGKHFRELSLLSGGERALTAISLLFALYLTKPSPFCILDEIDAPLDDLNINRFIHALKEFAQKVQFIIVTHNKMTMQAAKALYGVTMEEKGVSKIVSVKFEGNGKKKAENS
jgi:chromosome segregation protein